MPERSPPINREATVSWASVIHFNQPLKSVAIERSGPPPIGGVELAEALKAEYQAGYQAASDKFNAQILSMRQQMQAHAQGVLARLEASHGELVGQIVGELPELIVSGVYKIVGEQAMPADVLRARVEEIVARSCPPQEKVEIRLSPEDLATLSSTIPEYTASHARFSFIADATLKNGDCLLQTKFGQVDARLRVELQRLLQELSHT
jgi:flagellar assembly protein FliH